MKNSFLVKVTFMFFSVAIFTMVLNSGGIAKSDYIKVTPKVIVAKHAYGANITCLATVEGLYFVDCGMNTEVARQFRQDMEKNFHKKTLALLVTHPHIDHFFGMGAFSDVEVVAAETGKNLWKRQLAIKFTEEKIQAYTRIFPKFKESIKTAKPFLPNHWFKDKKIYGNGKDLLIFTNTGGHTSCSSSVYFPGQGVLVAGDLVQVDQYPYFGDPTTDMDKWLSTFKEWENMPIKKICPGHGRVVDKGYIILMKNYFLSLISKLKEFKKQELSVNKIIRHADLPQGYWGDDVARPVWFDYCLAFLYSKL